MNLNPIRINVDQDTALFVFDLWQKLASEEEVGSNDGAMMAQRYNRGMRADEIVGDRSGEHFYLHLFFSSVKNYSQ